MHVRAAGPRDPARCLSCGLRIPRCSVCGMHACSRPLCEPCFLDDSGIPGPLRAVFLANARAFQREATNGDHER